MSGFHRVDQRRAKLRPRTETEPRLPIRHSMVVVAGLSSLSWAVLVSIVLALRAVL